jgi:hypothetical protein
MQNWYNFLIKIKPDGKAFRSILFSKIFYEVLAYGLNLIKDYAIVEIDDQVWFVNDNFNPEPWERRYLINVPATSTLAERRLVVKSYMLFPQSSNRLSKDYIKNSLIEAGYTSIDISYNPTNITDGILRANDITEEKGIFSLGSLSYNNFIITGEITFTYYWNAIYLAMSLKPLQVAMYDTVDVLFAIALDDDFAIALDDNFAIALTVI